MTLLLIVIILAVALVLVALFSWAASWFNLAGRKRDGMPDEDSQGRRQAEHDLEAWRQANRIRVRVVEPKEPKP